MLQKNAEYKRRPKIDSLNLHYYKSVPVQTKSDDALRTTTTSTNISVDNTISYSWTTSSISISTSSYKFRGDINITFAITLGRKKVSRVLGSVRLKYLSLNDDNQNIQQYDNQKYKLRPNSDNTVYCNSDQDIYCVCNECMKLINIHKGDRNIRFGVWNPMIWKYDEIHDRDTLQDVFTTHDIQLSRDVYRIIISYLIVDGDDIIYLNIFGISRCDWRYVPRYCYGYLDKKKKLQLSYIQLDTYYSMNQTDSDGEESEDCAYDYIDEFEFILFRYQRWVSKTKNIPKFNDFFGKILNDESTIVYDNERQHIRQFYARKRKAYFPFV